MKVGCRDGCDETVGGGSTGLDAKLQRAMGPDMR